jgi:Mg-chelatase subunit ChlD
MSGLHCEQPGWLWAGAALIGAAGIAFALFHLALGTARLSSPKSRHSALRPWLLRAVRVGLVLAAIGQPTWTSGRGEDSSGQLILLIDRSASMPPHWSEQAIRDIASALPHADIHAFTFPGQGQAADLRQLLQPDSSLLAPADPADGSDPNAALQLSQSLSGGHEANTVLFLTDGNWTAPLRAPPGLQLWSLCPRQGRPHAGFIDLVAAPTSEPSTRPDGSARFFVRATLSATRTGEAAVRLSLRAGEKWAIIPGTEQNVQLATDQVHSVDWTISAPPLTQIRAELTAPADWSDNLPGDNPLLALTPAAPGRRPILLISSQPDDDLSRSLTRLPGWQVMRLSPSDLSARGATNLLSVSRPPGAVVLDNVPADALPNHVVSALRDYVNTGGGLLVVGGPNSLGAGHYFDSAIESLLPVISRPRNRPPAAIVLVLDRSGSMSESAGAAAPTGGTARSTPPGAEPVAAETPPGESKLDLVKQAVLGLPDLFAPGDRLAVIGFSDDAVTAYATPLDGTVDWQAVRKALRDMQARGGTAAEPAIRAAADWLAKQHVARKHLLLLTDGQFEDLSLGKAEALLRSTTQPASQLTVSTFAIGEQTGRKFLPDLAAKFGGTYYAPEQWGRLRDNFRDELAGATLEPILTGPFTVQTDSRDPLGPVSKVLADEQRPWAEVWYWAQTNSRRLPQPIVAVGPVGAGRSAVIATAWRPDWAGNWTDAQRDRLLTQLLNDLTGQDDAPRFLLLYNAEPADGKLVIELYATRRTKDAANGAADQPIDGLDLSADLIGSAGVTGSAPLRQTGPGKYVASLDWIDAARLAIVERSPAGSRVVVRRTLSAPVPAELRHLSPQPGKLDTLCRRLGGRLLESPAEASGLKLAAEPKTTPLWPALLLAALVLWLSAVTRLRQTKREMQNAKCKVQNDK